MRYKSQIFPLTYTSRAFVVFHQLSFHKTFWPRKGQKKSSRCNRRQERGRESARNPLSVSLSWEDATKTLLRARASASVCRLAHGGEKRGQSVIQFFFFEIFKERVKNTRTNERKRGVFFIEKKKKKKEESKFFTRRTLSRKESLCLCVSVSLSRVRVRERKRESNVGRRVRRRDRCI